MATMRGHAYHFSVKMSNNGHFYFCLYSVPGEKLRVAILLFRLWDCCQNDRMPLYYLTVPEYSLLKV